MNQTDRTAFAARFGKYAHKALGVDAVTVERSRKIIALIDRGATDGERAAAASRLNALADRIGVSVGALRSLA